MAEYFENQEHMIEFFKKEKNVHFDRVDRNGTTIFVDCTCDRCGGSGIIPYYGHVDNGVCFKCGGSGVGSNTEIKIYTPEYGAKLKAQRAAREQAKLQKLIAESADWNKKWMESEGFNIEGITFLILGNTYEIKEELKAHGAKYNDMLGWHMANAEGYDAVPLSIQQVTKHTEIGRLYYIDYVDGIDMVKKLKDDGEQALRAKNGEHISEYVGTVGERREFVCRMVGHFTYESHYSFYGELNHIYKFADENGDIIVWNTTAGVEEGKPEYRFKATIKEHSEYRGEKQTVVSRAKFS